MEEGIVVPAHFHSPLDGSCAQRSAPETPVALMWGIARELTVKL